MCGLLMLDCSGLVGLVPLVVVFIYRIFCVLELNSVQGPGWVFTSSSRLRLGVVPLFVDVEVKSIWSWPCVVR